MSDMEDLVEIALMRLTRNDNFLQPNKLVNIAGRFIYCHVINLLEVAIYNSHEACFCSI